VRVLERHDRPGGHAGVLERDGFRFDTGPSWYLMPDVFERFFAHFDREPGDYYALERLDPQYRMFWKDGDDVPTAPGRRDGIDGRLRRRASTPRTQSNRRQSDSVRRRNPRTARRARP